MNERIKELAEQCGFRSNPDIYDRNQSFDVTKFAELIIKECYEHCKGQMLPKGMAEDHGYDYNDGVMDCAIGLLLHFGVEE